MQRFLVEVYASQAAREWVEAAASRARVASAELSCDGRSVEYVRSIFVPEDEMCFHVFESDSREIVARVAARARLEHQRIVEAIVEEDGGR